MTLVQAGAWASLALAVPAAWSLGGRAAGRDASALRALCAAVAYAALLVVPLHVEAALELVGILDRMTLWGPALAAAVILLAERRARPDPNGGIGRGEGGESSVTEAMRGLPRSVRASAALLGLVYLLFAVEGLTGVPDTWDSVRYHLPVAVRWLREGSLSLGAGAHYYEAIPANADLFSMVTLATGWTSLAAIWNLVSLTAAAAAVHVLARAVGADERGRAVAVLVVAGLPIVLFQTFSAYVDLFVAGFLVAAVALLAALATGSPASDGTRSPRRPMALVLAAGMACGLAVGAKATAWPTGLVVAVCGTGWILLSPRTEGRRLALVWTFGLAVAAACVFWFARNWIETGNPAYPLEITLLGHQLFEGTAPETITRQAAGGEEASFALRMLVYPWTEAKMAGYPYSVGSGLGPLFAAFAVPGLIYALWPGPARDGGMVEATRSTARRRARLALAALVGVFVATWWGVLAPLWRFAMPWILLLCVLAGPLFGALHGRVPRTAGRLLVACTLVLALVASLPTARALAHRALHGEWSWSEQYHLPPEYGRVPPDATVINYDVDQEAWNNFALLGPAFRRRVITDWETKRRLEEGDRPFECGAYVVDRPPFRLEPGSAEMHGASARLVAETVAQHGDVPWRIWRIEPGNGCEPSGADRRERRPAARAEAAEPRSHVADLLDQVLD